MHSGLGKPDVQALAGQHDLEQPLSRLTAPEAGRRTGWPGRRQLGIWPRLQQAASQPPSSSPA